MQVKPLFFKVRTGCQEVWRAYNEQRIHFVDSQVSQDPLHSHTNIHHLRDYTEHAYEKGLFSEFHKQHGNSIVHLYSISPVSAPEAAILRALGDVLMFLSCTDKPQLLTLTQTLCLQLVL